MTSRRAEELSLPFKVRDLDGLDYTLTKLVAPAGGQGAVFEEKAGGLAVKILDKAGARTARIFEDVVRLPIGGLPIARPLARIGEPHGFVMELLSGLETWESLIPRGSGGALLESWTSSGGLTRRYSLASSLAGTMARLADRGITYADLSAKNVLVTPRDDPSQVAWLIDVDNMRHGRGDIVWTLPYGAPEMVSGLAPCTTTLTDVWSLAAIVFESLTGLHPLFGEGIQDAPYEEEMAALRGGHPWIDDPIDRSNSNPNGLARDRVLTKPLQAIFHRMFGAGRLEPSNRPGAGELALALEDASLLTAACPVCELGNIARTNSQCIGCGAELGGFTLLRVMSEPLTPSEREAMAEPFVGLGDSGEPHPPSRVHGSWLALGSDKTLAPPGRRLAYGAGEDPVLSLRSSKGGIHVTPLAGIPIYRLTPQRDFAPIRPAGFTVMGDLHLRIGQPDQPHRYLHTAQLRPRP